VIEIKADRKSYLRLKEQLELIGLDTKKRKRLLKKVGQQIAKKTKQNIRAQRDPEGRAWRKRKKGKKKMFKKLVNKIKHFQRNNNRDLYVGWPTRRGIVASNHHEGKVENSGLRERFKQGRKSNEPKKTDPATREQAKELRELGWRLPSSGRQKRGKKPTIKFITSNMSVGEAAKEINKLESKTPARKWDINRPERRLIGIRPKRLAMMIKREMKRNRSK